MSCTCYSTREKVPTTALALAGALCLAGTLAPVHAAPDPIMLSDVARGTGGFVINGSRPYAQFGSVVSGGADANGDGLSDIQVGFRTKYSTSISLPDVNYLVHGKPDGAAVNLSRLAAGQGGGFVAGATNSLLQPVAALGYSAALGGDINGDGLADFVTTASGSGTGSTIAQRFVVFGQTGISPVEAPSISAGTGGFVVRGSSPTPTLGPGVCRAVAVLGDVNGDGLADIGLACPTASTGGMAYVVFGRTDTAPLDHTTIEAGTGGFVVRGTSGLPVDGQVVALGDVNGDGLHDLLLSGVNNGIAVVVFGKSSTSPVEASAMGNAPNHAGYLVVKPSGSFMGTWAGAGDLDGDSLGDIALVLTSRGGLDFPAVVSYGKSGADTVQMGSIYGGTAGFRILSSIPFVNPRVPAVAASGVGDLNGDGFGDLAISIVGSDYVPTPYANSGRVYVIFGTSQRPNVQLSQVGDAIAGFTVSAANSRSWNTGAALAPGGDIDGDGMADVVVGSPGASVGYSSLATVRATSTPNWSTGQIYAVLNPLDPAATSAYTANVPAGNPGAVGPGGRTFGRDTTIFVDGRAWVDFADGTGPGPGGSSTLGVTLTRSDAGIGGGLPASGLADVQWSLTSNRTHTAAPRVSVQYTDAEIAGLNEAGLQLLTAPTTAGPFVPVESPSRNAARNLISGMATLPAVFVIVDASPRATITRLNENPTLDQNPAWQVTFDRPVAPSFSLLDVVPTGSLASANLIDLRLTGLDPNYIVQAFTTRSPEGGSLGFTLPAGAVSAGGLLNATTEAPPYTIQAAQPAAALAGDMNKDSVVNVADVTALADHIVNGTPLP